MTDRPSFTRLWASKGESVDPDAKYVNGFIQEKPEHGHLNFVQRQEEDFYLSLAEDGVYFKKDDALVTHVPNSIATFFDVDKDTIRIFKDGVYKDSLGSATEAEYLDVLHGGFLSLSTHQMRKDNPHKVTAAQANTYTKEEFEAKLTDVDSSTSSHVGKTDNPHKVTYEQLGVLPTTGGTFTGGVEFSATTNYFGGLPFTTNPSPCYGDGTVGIGFDAQGLPSYWKDGYPYLFITEVTYPIVRGRLEERFAVPCEDVRIPFGSDLTAWQATTTINTSWDDWVFDKTKGFKIDGSVNFDGSNFLGLETTVSVRLSGDVTLSLGSIIIHRNGDAVAIADGTEDLAAAYTGDTLVYVRSNDKLYLYIDGVEVATAPFEPTVMRTPCTISGTGYIKDLRVWSSPLTAGQVSMISYRSKSKVPTVCMWTPNYK